MVSFRRNNFTPFYLVYLVAFLMFFSCVPTKKTILLRDPSKKNISDIQQLDTVVENYKFSYKINKRDFIKVDLENYITPLKNSENSIRSNNSNSRDNIGNKNTIDGYEVNQNGDIELPILGKINVYGLTLEECRNAIQKKSSKYLKNTFVKVSLGNYYVTALGELNKTGVIRNNKDYMTLIEAIGLSGGLLPYANLKKIKIIRKDASTNKTHIFYVDISDYNTITKEDFYLYPNDIFVVEPLRVKSYRNYTSQNITLSITILGSLLILYNVITQALR